MNLAMTCLFTSIDNPLCPLCDNYKPDVEMLRNWLASLEACNAYVLHDELTGEQWYRGCEIAAVPTSFFQVEMSDENLFFQRWRHIYSRLVRATHVEFVFITDGSDVRMLNEPWSHMRPKTLYVGSEEDTISNKWIVDNHPTIRDLAKRAKNQPLLNAGLLGGDRITIMDFVDRLIWRLDNSDGDLTDMAAFNLTLYEDWDGYVETGYPVHTTFGKWVKKDKQAYWAHK